MPKCNLNDECERDVYIDDKCVLHCRKNDYQIEQHSEILSGFYDAFLNYMINCTDFTKKELNTFLKTKDVSINDDEENKFIKKGLIIIVWIYFPFNSNYLNILNLFKMIFFDSCEFYDNSLNLNHDVECSFTHCNRGFEGYL